MRFFLELLTHFKLDQWQLGTRPASSPAGPIAHTVLSMALCPWNFKILRIFFAFLTEVRVHFFKRQRVVRSESVHELNEGMEKVEVVVALTFVGTASLNIEPGQGKGKSFSPS
jgi:hypothetical protein